MAHPIQTDVTYKEVELLSFLSGLVGGTAHSVGCNDKHFVAVVVVFFDLKMF